MNRYPAQTLRRTQRRGKLVRDFVDLPIAIHENSFACHYQDLFRRVDLRAGIRMSANFRADAETRKSRATGAQSSRCTQPTGHGQ
jgi:hypothetical protein